jgi:HK97 family phage major capsid protein
MRRGNYGGIVPQLRRQLRVLDLLPTGTMDENTFPYTQESGSFTTAAETAEGGLKPEGGLTLTDAEAVAATIAHWLKIRKQALADSSALQSIVDSRLRYGVERRLEAEVLAGDGSARTSPAS